MEELLRKEEVAEILKISPRTVWKWKHSGMLPFVEIAPRTYRYRRGDVLRMIERKGQVKK
jgi:excisionase family DNA binding protein